VFDHGRRRVDDDETLPEKIDIARIRGTSMSDWAFVWNGPMVSNTPYSRIIPTPTEETTRETAGPPLSGLYAIFSITAARREVIAAEKSTARIYTIQLFFVKL
jgi:hypothetical protein